MSFIQAFCGRCEHHSHVSLAASICTILPQSRVQPMLGTCAVHESSVLGVYRINTVKCLLWRRAEPVTWFCTRHHLLSQRFKDVALLLMTTQCLYQQMSRTMRQAKHVFHSLSVCIRASPGFQHTLNVTDKRMCRFPHHQDSHRDNLPFSLCVTHLAEASKQMHVFSSSHRPSQWL